jgi:hypothetical protein
MMSLYCLWMFLFDDMIDAEITPGVTNFASNYDMASEYRGQTIDFVRYYLGLAEPDTPKPEPPTVICELFAGISPLMQKYLNKEQIQDLYKSLEFFIKANAVEQENRLSGKFPSVKNFYTWRLGTTAVDSMCDIG